MSNRWFILFVLFLARLTMGFQFQSVAALSPLIAEHYAVSLTDIGLLIGLYLAPGVIVAIPGGALAARFGDKRIVVISLFLMLFGGAMMAYGPAWSWFTTGRVIAGMGGVIINIVMTKMVVDWFTGREISTALAIFINSWPVGIALGLLILPMLASAGGLVTAWAAVNGLIVLGLAFFLFGYRPPEGAQTGPVEVKVSKLPVVSLVLAASIWALYNTALAMVFSFGPALLGQLGWSLTLAASATSVFMLLLSVSVPLGGILADWTGRRDTVISVSMMSYILLMPLIVYMPAWAVPVVFVLVGLLFGLAAGPIMTLPSLVLPPQSRSFGMGVFFSIYYGVMMLGPPLAGNLADRTGTIGIAFVLGTIMLLMCLAALALFRRVAVVLT